MYLRGRLTIDLAGTEIVLHPPRNFFGSSPWHARHFACKIGRTWCWNVGGCWAGACEATHHRRAVRNQRRAGIVIARQTLEGVFRAGGRGGQ